MHKIVFTFDCYGTLINWIEGVEREFIELYSSIRLAKKFIKYWSEKDWELVNSGVYIPYRRILETSFKYALDKIGLDYNDDTLRKLVHSIYRWPPFPDVKPTLEKIRDMNIELGIISNTDRDFIIKSIDNIGIDFDYIIVAEDIGIYKPDPRVFLKAGEYFKNFRWIHVSAYPNYDIEPATKIGVETILVDRYRYTDRGEVPATYIVKKFGDIVDIGRKII